MGKSIRSKIKRKHRTEFRNTVGDDFAKSKMDEVQAKLKEVIGKTTGLPSVERLSSLLDTDGGTSSSMMTVDGQDDGGNLPNISADDTAGGGGSGDVDKIIPHKKGTGGGKHGIEKASGRSRARYTRKESGNSRGGKGPAGTSGIQVRRKRSSSKKRRKETCAF